MKRRPVRLSANFEMNTRPYSGSAIEETFIARITKRLYHEIELALIFQLSLIYGRVISPEYLLTYGVKEVHPHGIWLFKYHGMPIVRVTPPSFRTCDGSTNACWKVSCLPLNKQKLQRLYQKTQGIVTKIFRSRL